MTTLGYNAAKGAVEAGREAFFRNVESNLPVSDDPEVLADDLIPQFGYIGPRYAEQRVLVIGINPGNGDRTGRSAGDAAMMPPLHAFAAAPTADNYAKANAAYYQQCPKWKLWHLAPFVGPGRLLPFDSFAYSNCLPWRTKRESDLHRRTAEAAARLYALPLIEELQPNLILAYGLKAKEILMGDGAKNLPQVIAWTRERAARDEVKELRRVALEALRASLSGS